MKTSNLFFLGMSAVLLAFGLVLAGCDNGGGGGSKGEYHLKWGLTTYSAMESAITSQGWTVADSGTDWALATGSTAKSVYDYCMGNLHWSDGDDFDGSFEECINFSKNNVSAPEELKTAGKNYKGHLPLAGVFAAGNSGALLFYITKN